MKRLNSSQNNRVKSVKSTRDSEFGANSTNVSHNVRSIKPELEILPERTKTMKTKLSEITKKTKATAPNLPTLTNKSMKKVRSEANHKISKLEVQESQNLNQLLNLQTDPLLKGVYSPSFFATSFTPYSFADDMLYKFDSYKVKVPSLLVGDKL